MRNQIPAISYYLGIDGGGTKTDFILCDAKGAILRHITLGACNPGSVGIEKSASVLTSGIKMVCEGFPMKQMSVFAGIAGCGIEKYRTPIEKVLTQFGFSAFRVSTDADNIISAGLRGKDGIIVILGTGSVIFSMKSGIRHQIGGYGHLIGDDFSGSMLGAACLRAALLHQDGSGRPTVITDLVKTHIDGEITEVVPEIYSHGKDYLASFAPLLFEAVAKGDEVALEIMEQNISQLAMRLKGALKDYEARDEKVKIVLAGGLTHVADYFYPKLLEELTDAAPHNIEILKESPTIGALWLAGLESDERKGVCYVENRDEK